MPVKQPIAAELEPIETASQDELRALQLQRMQWSLQHAYDNVPHYRHSFAAAGVHPAELRSLEDLRQFPFTTKGDLRQNYPFGMFAVPREPVVRIHASSGTTGKPTVVDSVTVHVEPAGSEAAACQTASRQLTDGIKAYVGISVRVNLGAPGSIERSIGKAKRVIDKRNVPAG